MARLISAPRIATLMGDFDRSPAYRGLAEGLRVLITDGRVPVGVRLPSERELTEALEVSRTTVTRAYAQLRDHGFLVSRQGSGSVASLPTGRGHRGDHLLPPGCLPKDKIDLTCAAPVPGRACWRPTSGRSASSRRTSRAPATTPPGCRPSARPWLRRTPLAGWPPAPTRSWSCRGRWPAWPWRRAPCSTRATAW